MGRKRAKVQLMSSWTRSSDQDAGAMGAGVAFVEPKSPGQRIPNPTDTKTHTATLLNGLEKVFTAAPPDADLEVELTHRLLVRTFAQHGTSPRDILETAKFLKSSGVLHRILVPSNIVQEFLVALSKRSGNTSFSMWSDTGRYMTLATTQMQPPGIIAAKRLEAVERGSFMIFRAVGNNEDLLEVRWAAVIDEEALVYQDRFRDIAVGEMLGLRAWAGALDSTKASSDQHEFTPELLAAEDPGMFWSCVRHGGPLLQNWSEAARLGQSKAVSEREEALKAANLSCDPEFSGDQNYDVALIADIMLRKSLQEMKGTDEDSINMQVMEMFERDHGEKETRALQRAEEREAPQSS